MAAEITVTPPSGEIQAKLDAIHVRVTGAEVWNDDGTQHRYRFRLDPPSGSESITWSGYSELFNVSADGKHEWNTYIFPVDGEWTIRFHDEEADTDEATLAVTVV